MADLTSREHYERHVVLHRSLDELAAEWIGQSGMRPSQISLLDFMIWSGEQVDILKPDEDRTPEDPRDLQDRMYPQRDV